MISVYEVSMNTTDYFMAPQVSDPQPAPVVTDIAMLGPSTIWEPDLHLHVSTVSTMVTTSALGNTILSIQVQTSCK